MEGLRGLSEGISRDGGPPPGLVEPSSSKACFSQRCTYTKQLVILTILSSSWTNYLTHCSGITFLQEPVVGGVSGISRERLLLVGTPGVLGLRLARNGDEKRT